ncbi:MAG: ATP-grasp domain-containing protein [Burkholderiales bacterium]
MRILVYEHMTSGGYRAGAAALVREGDAMLRALLADLCVIPGVELVTLRDERLPRNLPCEVKLLRDQTDLWPAMRRAIGECDAVWPIAPETGGWLERISEEVINQGRVLLNSGLDAVRITSSKWRTSQVLHAAGIPVVKTYRSMQEVPPEVERIVAKPDDGAGCVDTSILRRGDRAPSSNAVFQPYIEGDPRSFALLCSGGTAQLLCVNRQIIEEREGVLCFVGVETGVLEDAGDEIALLGRRILAAIPDLSGFVGVDFLETQTGPVVIEINPRLTCAYVGMSARLGFNVAAQVKESFQWEAIARL